jgi:2-polyprenyl-6-methoxyphenol hydroxylase-like FAD-dependent oxidoreductase
MARPFDVCIRGAGITGRVLALLLARDRLKIGLVPGPAPATEGHTDVRAYALNSAAKALLESLRCWPDAQQATPVLAMQVHGDDGGQVNFSAHDQGTEALAWIVDVPALEARLANAVGFAPQIELLDAPAPATLTVVCEGRASATRAELGVVYDVTPYAQCAIAARVSCAQPHGQAARQWFSGGEILGLLPLQGAQGNSVALVWSVSQDHAQELMGLAPEAFATQLQVASHGSLGDLALSSERVVWPLQLARANRWVGKTAGGAAWALAGDAAHTVHPLAGQGLNLGLADVAELARVLHEKDYWRGVGDEKLLRHYERARKADVLAMGLTTDGLQQLFAQPGSAWRSVRNWGMQGFEHSGPLKAWMARRAMGANAAAQSAGSAGSAATTNRN